MRLCLHLAIILSALTTLVHSQYSDNAYGSAAPQQDPYAAAANQAPLVTGNDNSYDYNAIGDEQYATEAVFNGTSAFQTPATPAETYADETPHPLLHPALPTINQYAGADESIEEFSETSESTESSDTTESTEATSVPNHPELPDYSVRPLNVSAAIFEHIAPVQFYTQRWKIQAHVQLPDFSEALDAIDRYDELVRQVCDGFRNARAQNATLPAAGNKTEPLVEATGAALQTHCRNAEREVTLLTERVRTTNEELRKVTTSAARNQRHRSRRDVEASEAAAVKKDDSSAASAARQARQLYLAVEEVVSDRLYDRVELLEREAQWGFRLMKNELGVLRGTNQAVYKTVWKLTDVQKENDANIKKMVKKLRGLRSAVAREADETQARLTLVELVQLISLELTGMVEQQNEVLSLVTTSAAGRLHPMVMAVADLSRVYANMSQAMGLSEILVSGDEMPKMVSIKSAQNGRDVEVLIEVPMVKREEFQLYRAYALPRRLPGSTKPSAVQLEEQYLAVNEADQTYVQLSEADLQACTALDSAATAQAAEEDLRYVCKLTSPLFTSGADSCLISLFQQRPLEETPCEMEPRSRRNTVTKMRMSSTWLWLAENATTVRMRCANRPVGEEDEVLVAAQSIVQLNGMCELESATFRLQAESTIFRNATVVQSKQMTSGSNIAAIDEFVMQQGSSQPTFAAHELDQDPIRLTQPRRYHRWLNQNGRAIQALTRSFRQVEAARKKEKQSIAATPDGQTDYMQVILTMGQMIVRVVRLIVGLVTRLTGEEDDFDFF